MSVWRVSSGARLTSHIPSSRLLYLFVHIFIVVLFDSGENLVTTGLWRSSDSGQGSSAWPQLRKVLLKQLTSAQGEERVQCTTRCSFALGGLYCVVPCWCKTVLRLMLNHWIRSVLDISAEKGVLRLLSLWEQELGDERKLRHVFATLGRRRGSSLVVEGLFFSPSATFRIAVCATKLRAAAF